MHTSKVRNVDYADKDIVWQSPINNEVISYFPFEAPDLIEALADGKLSGRLKELASTLDEEDNPVIMLVKRR
jgi:hypothetical protein